MHCKTKIFFVHIPKTGGVSIEQTLGRLIDLELCPAYNSDEFLKLETPGRYNLFHGHLEYFVRELISPDFTFTILRDPIERAMSAFEHIARDSYHPSHSQYLDAPNIISALEHNMLRPHFSNAMTYFLGLRPEFGKFRTAGSALRHAQHYSPPESLLRHAKAALEEMDFVGFTESLEASQEYLHTRLAPAFEPDFQVISSNQNPLKPASPYKERLSPEALQKLREANALDLELYAHARSLAKRRGWLPGLPLSKAERDRKNFNLEMAKREYFEALERKPELSSLNYDFSQPLEGSGWHPRETDGQKHWRFTGPGERACLYFPRLPSRTSTLTLDVLHAVTPEHFGQFQIKINGVCLEERAYRGMQVCFSIPAKALAEYPYTCIEILTPPCLQPSEQDARKLGIAFTACRIS